MYMRQYQGHNFFHKVDDNGNSVYHTMNFCRRKAYGAELSAITRLKMWKIDLNLNVFHAQIDGSNIAKIRNLYVHLFARQTSRSPCLAI